MRVQLSPKDLAASSSAYFFTIFLLSPVATAVKVQFLPRPVPWFTMLYASFTVGLLRGLMWAAMLWGVHLATLFLLNSTRRLAMFSRGEIVVGSVLSAYFAELAEFPLYFELVKLPVNGMFRMLFVQGLLITILAFELYRTVLLRRESRKSDAAPVIP